MAKTNKIHAAKYALYNFHCGKCETGIVQLHQQSKRNGLITSTISGCLDCGYEYGINQAQDLKICSSEQEIRWA